MDNTLYLRDASKIKQAIIEYASKDTKVYYFPTSLIDNADCEVFLSVWRGNYGDIIKLNVRTYSDIPDYKKQSLSLSFGAPKKTLSLGEACGVPVKSNRKGGYVTRLCTEVTLPSVFEIINEKELCLTDGVTSKRLKITSTKTQRTKLALFLATCFGLEPLNDELKDLIMPLIEQESQREQQAELKRQDEQKRQKEEEGQKKKKEEEAKLRKAEEEKRKEEERRKRESQLLIDTKGLLSMMWNYNNLHRKDFCFQINEKGNHYCLFGYVRANRIEISDLTYSREYIIEILELLENNHIISRYTCKENNVYINDLSINIIIPSYSIDSDDRLFDVLSLQQLFDVLDKKASLSDIKESLKKSPTSSGCYIATTIYGSYDCPEVWTLRRFRDLSLAQTGLGRLFIKTYYAVSPTLVKWFGQSKWFKTLWHEPLDYLVNKLQKRGFEDTPYQDKY